MRKLLKVLVAVFVFLLVVLFVLERYLNNGSKTPDNTVWQSYIGRDTTVGILPDAYANYFTYTAARTRKNVGYRIKGKFPDTRYFSFNVYSLGDNATQGSLVDYQIKTNSGLPNPFIAHSDSTTVDDEYTVHILPASTDSDDLDNVLTFRDNVRLLAIVMRLYDYNIDDFGGVEFPTIEAIDLSSGEQGEFKGASLPKSLNLRTIVRNFSLPKMVKRLSLLYLTENTVALDMEDRNEPIYTIPFHGVDASGFIENNDNRYLMAAITKKEDEVYVFKFKSPSYTTGPENITRSDVRYWSFNLGNDASYNFNAIKDEDALVDSDGFVHIVLGHRDEELVQRCELMGFNFMEWNMPWKKGLILFRHMLANPNFEAQIDDVPPLLEKTKDYEQIEAYKFMGDFAPQGQRMTLDQFLRRYQSLDEPI